LVVVRGSFLDHLPCLAVVNTLAAVDTLVVVVRGSFLDHLPCLAAVNTPATADTLAVVRGSLLEHLAFGHLPFKW
jgi:hypothetical protein